MDSYRSRLRGVSDGSALCAALQRLVALGCAVCGCVVMCSMRLRLVALFFLWFRVVFGCSVMCVVWTSSRYFAMLGCVWLCFFLVWFTSVPGCFVMCGLSCVWLRCDVWFRVSFGRVVPCGLQL